MTCAEIVHWIWICPLQLPLITFIAPSNWISTISQSYTLPSSDEVITCIFISACLWLYFVALDQWPVLVSTIREPKPLGIEITGYAWPSSMWIEPILCICISICICITRYTMQIKALISIPRKKTHDCSLRRGASKVGSHPILPCTFSFWAFKPVYIQRHLGQSVAVCGSLWQGRSWKTKAKPGTAG